MTRRPQTRLAAFLTAFALFGCGSENADFNILDAASTYRTHRDDFVAIRRSYPGPFEEFVRVPARDPSKSTPEEKVLLDVLRKNFPVEYIDFFPLANTGKDEIDVVLTRYGVNEKWTIVSLVYSGVPLPPPTDDPNMALFDTCDERALAWVSADRGDQSASAFCRIDEHWYAFQRVG